MKILDFPIVRQSTNYTCSCASLLSCLCYYGIDKREKQLANLMNVTSHSVEIHPRKIVKAAKHFGLKAIYRKLTINELKRCIDKNRPVIVNFQAWSDSKNPDYSKDDNGHYATVIGYTKKRLIFSDPSSFYRTYLSYEEFEKRWHDGSPDDYDYDHRGVVIWGKPVCYNRKNIKKTK